jgi:predicted nucleic acid-binding protein
VTCHATYRSVKVILALKGLAMKGIADTGFLVAFVSLNDRHHQWAVSVAEDFIEPLLTCEAVLSETAFHLGSCSAVLKLINEQLITLAFDCNDHLPQLEALAKRYADRKPDLADLCLIRLSEVHLKHRVVTIDSDFRIYRRNKRDAIPLICPLGK